MAIEPKSKIAATLLCLFLGTFGGHRFYLGYTTIGIVQFLTLGGFFIWSTIDFIQILVGTLRDSKGNDLVM